jgi:hypothetical protein
LVHRGLPTAAAHKLHVLDVPDEVCLARLQARNAEGPARMAGYSSVEFDELSRYFEQRRPLVCFWIILLIGIAIAIVAMWSMLYRPAAGFSAASS